MSSILQHAKPESSLAVGCRTLVDWLQIAKPPMTVSVWDDSQRAIVGEHRPIPCSSIENLRLACIFAAAQHGESFGSRKGGFGYVKDNTHCSIMYDFSADPPGLVLYVGADYLPVDDRLFIFRDSSVDD
jgi:hypothetical protein